QLVDGHGRREDLVGPHVASGVRDDEHVAGGQHGVEQELAVLGAAVVVAHVPGPGEEVVAVGRAAAGEGEIVEAGDAHDSVGDGAHWHEGAHGELARTEGGPARL